MILKDLKRYIESELIEMYNTNESESIACIIIEEKLSYDKANIILNYRNNVENCDINDIDFILHRLKQNEPIQYILGEVEFYDLHFKINKFVLIPRPETELLVDKVIKYNENNTDLRILDIGTGSGCIAISLAENIKKSVVDAIDISEEALVIAKENAIINNVDVAFMQLDILEPIIILNEELDIIVSNPPYVKEEEKGLMERNALDFEPLGALFVSNENPLLYYDAIAKFAKQNLKKGGQAWLEINEVYGNEVSKLLKDNGFASVEIILDYNKKHRFVLGIM